MESTATAPARLISVRPMELDIPHNYFPLWMVTPSRALAGSRAVDHLKTDLAPLLRALESYRWR